MYRFGRVYASWAIVAAAACAALPAHAQTPGVRPKNLIVYYGIPSLVNGSAGNVTAAEAVFNQYDYIIFGAGLQDPTSVYNASTKTIIQYLVSQGKKVFGYEDIGVTTNNYAITKIQADAANWVSMGVTGIFLDDFGYDYGVTRSRQSDALDAVHSAGVGAILNASNPDDVFRTPYGSTAYPHVYTNIDYYFYESYQISQGAYSPEAYWRWKSGAIAYLQTQFSPAFQVLSIATPDFSGTYNATKYGFSWSSALFDGHTATGWANDQYYSAGSSALTFHTPPTTSPSHPNGHEYSLDANNGWLSIDYTTTVPSAYWTY